MNADDVLGVQVVSRSSRPLLPLLILRDKHGRAHFTSTVAAFVFLAYDTCLTFADEVEHIWSYVILYSIRAVPDPWPA